MPIPFVDTDDSDQLGSAAYLKLERSVDNGCCLGALFVISARGEPLEFGYNRLRVPGPHLWRRADLERYIERRLAISLLSVCSQQPRLLLCLANEVTARLFSRGLLLEVPVARIAEPRLAARQVDTTTGEILAEPAPRPHIDWQPAAPEVGSFEQRLFEHLSTHDLLLEPFQRATVGLQEVYGSGPCPFGP